MELDIGAFRRGMEMHNRQKQEGRTLMDYVDAIEFVKEELKPKLEGSLDDKLNDKNREIIKKDKEYLRKLKEINKEYVSEIVFGKDVHVRGYEGNKIYDFIDEVIEDICGYSILAKAFEDPEVSDIYVIDWETIFVEKKGKNQKYIDDNGKPITFRSAKHYKDTLDRFIREAGKEINNGENKIVDFELFGDRGCATSPIVSPRDYSLTIRKHSESHITRNQLVEWNVLTEEMADFLGMLILGECNIVYAGITGSGKTTTIRALLDYYVTKAGKRMLICEDTQELFPQNEHSLELVSVKHDDKKLAIELDQLILTALRLKPKYIVVGEVRGKEAMAMVEGGETGHSTIATMHGGTPVNIINRLVTKYMMAMPTLGIEVVERIIGESVDYICIQDHIPEIGFKLTSISEIKYNFKERTVSIKPICEFDFKTHQFRWIGKIDMNKANKMMRRGIPWKDLEQWVDVSN